MGNTPKAQYVDADKLKMALDQAVHVVSMPYSNGQLDQQINNLIFNSLVQSFEAFKYQIINAIDQASVPYDKCMLCVQRDSCIPDHPLGDNR